MSSRGTTFGAVAAAYERYRPGYPDDVVDMITQYAGRPVRSALEIGAGTGKATRLFDAYGVIVTATDPDAGMLAELRRHVSPAVTTTRARLEDLAPDRAYDLVYAAASLHWTEAAGRWARISRLLAADGVFACFGGPSLLADHDLEREVRAARRPWLTDDDVPSPDGTPPEAALQWPGTELERSPLFTDVRQIVIARRTTVTAADYVGLLSTVSAYLTLPAAQREDVLGAISRVLPGKIALVADLHVHLARRVA